MQNMKYILLNDLNFKKKQCREVNIVNTSNLVTKKEKQKNGKRHNYILKSIAQKLTLK